MKKLLLQLMLFTLFCIGAFGQSIKDSYNPIGNTKFTRAIVEKTFFFPTGCGVPSGTASLVSDTSNRAALFFDSCGHKAYAWDPKSKAWGTIGADSTVYATIYRLLRDSTHLSNRIIDTAGVLRALINTKQPLGSYLVAGNNLADVTNITTARSNLGLGNVDNTSDVNKPVSTAQAAADALKVDKTITVNGQALSSNVTITKSDVGLGSVPNVDATNASNISSGTLADARLSGNVTVQGNSFNGANQLVKTGSDGKLLPGVIPALALVDTYTPASQAAMLALSAEQGDIAIRTDINVAYILYQAPATTLGNWIALPAPSSETDPLYTASSWYGTTNNSSNWNTAYSWGNWAAGSHYIGTTLIANNRASASQSLTGVSIDGTAGNATTWNAQIYDPSKTGDLLDGIMLRSVNDGKWFKGTLNDLIGTATSLNIGGNAATATLAANSTLFAGQSYTNSSQASPGYFITTTTGNNWDYTSVANVVTRLGGPFLPLTAGSSNKLTSDLFINAANSGLVIQGNSITMALYGSGNTLRITNSIGTLGFYSDLTTGAFTQLGTGAFTWNGSVGIGTSTFTYDGRGAGFAYQGSAGTMYIRNTGAELYTYGVNAYLGAGTSGYSTILVSGAAQTALTLASNQYATFASSVGINTAATSNVLDVQGTANNWTGIFKGSATTGQSYGIAIYAGTNSGDYPLYVNKQDNTQLFSVRGDGLATFASTVTATAFYESSDIRQKKVHKTVSSIDGIDAIQYTFKPNGTEKWGYSAQQVQEILPFAVTNGSDGFLKLDYTTVHTYKISVHDVEIADLKKNTADLQKTIVELQSRDTVRVLKMTKGYDSERLLKMDDYPITVILKRKISKEVSDYTNSYLYVGNTVLVDGKPYNGRDKWYAIANEYFKIDKNGKMY